MQDNKQLYQSFTTEEINGAISKPKCGKAYGCDSITLEHAKVCWLCVIKHVLCKLFNIYLTFGYIPEFFT